MPDAEVRKWLLNNVEEKITKEMLESAKLQEVNENDMM